MLLKDCFFENHVFPDGEAFPNPLNVCEECKCVSGLTECRQTQCPRPRCNAPLSGLCCPNNCNGEELSTFCLKTDSLNSIPKSQPSALGCSYAGKEYPNGQEFPHPTNSCRTCSCIVICIYLYLWHNVGVLITCGISMCIIFIAEWECPVFEKEVSSAVVLKPKCAAWRLLPQMSQ